MRFTPGELFQQKYRVHHLLGHGGFATVFAADDVELRRRVAIKVLLPGTSDTSEARFLREARVLATLRDPHTIRLYDFGTTDDGTHFMVFEYVPDAQDLSGRIATFGPQPPDVVRHVLEQLLSALSEAHAAGVLHRDIKPANVLVYRTADDPWCVKLIDFGIAKSTPRNGRAVTQLTQEGSLLGTPRYMPPEAFVGEESTPASDLYSLGLVALELLTGKPAVAGAQIEDVVRRALSDEPFVVPVTGSALDRVLPRMLQRNAAARPHSVAQVQRELAGISGGPAEVTVAAKRADRRVLGVVALLAVTAAGLALMVAVQRAPEPAQRPIPSSVRDNPLAAVPEKEVETETPDALTAPADEVADGCGRDVSPGLRKHGASMTWFTYVPTSYDPSYRHRVVVLLHNALRDGQVVIDGTNFAALADEQRLILVAPSSPGTTAWNRPNDVDFVKDVIARAKEDLCVDERYIYALGHGGGGDFALEARCHIAFSAVAITASGEYLGYEPCDAPPMPMLRIYGRDDRHVPKDGGAGCYGGRAFKTARVIEQEWATWNQTPRGPTTWLRESGGTCKIWRAPKGTRAKITGPEGTTTEPDAVTVSCEVPGGHDWPGLAAPFELPKCAAKPLQFPLRDTVWRFFEEHGVALPRAEDASAPVVDHPVEEVDPSR